MCSIYYEFKPLTYLQRTMDQWCINLNVHIDSHQCMPFQDAHPPMPPPSPVACPSSLISVRATRATNSPVSVMIGNLPFLEVCKSLLACNKSIPSFAVTNSFTGVMMELSRVFLSLMKSLVGPCCTGVKVLMPYIQTSTASLTCNRSTCKGRLASTFYQEAVSRLVTSPRSGRPICPPSVTGKPVKPNLLFNSSSSFRKHPTSISAERGFTHQTPHYGQMA